MWYRAKSGRWVLAEPKAGTVVADPHKAHLCDVRKTEMALRRTSRGFVGRNGTRSYKPSLYRLR